MLAPSRDWDVRTLTIWTELTRIAITKIMTMMMMVIRRRCSSFEKKKADQKCFRIGLLTASAHDKLLRHLLLFLSISFTLTLSFSMDGKDMRDEEMRSRQKERRRIVRRKKRRRRRDCNWKESKAKF